eukprot:Rhum_TRINITY_DN13286_c3_g1::Rhum_TRINITY_DN13286_c3_g1_i1::g.58146::m.58146
MHAGAGSGGNAGGAGGGAAYTLSEPCDIATYLVGTWKRCLEERDFGGAFQFKRNSNVLIQIDAVGNGACGGQVVAWKLLRSLNRGDSAVMYSMEVTPKSDTEAALTYTYEGVPCVGRFINGANALVLTHTDTGTPCAVVTITYRLIDANTMALVIAECDAASPQHSRILTGTMHRVDLSAYSLP